MGDCVNLSLNNQTFQTSAVVIGAKAGSPAVQGLTVYGDISASGRIYSVDSGLVKMSLPGNGGYQYVMPFAPSPNSQDYIVSIDGVLQEAGKSFFVSSRGLINFSENIPVGSTIMILVNRLILSNSTNVPSFKKTFYIAPGSTTSFLLSSYSNDNPDNYFVYIDGVMQASVTDYSIVNDQVVFTEPPASGQRILVLSLQNQDGTYAALNSGLGSNFQLSCIPLPQGSLDSHVLTYDNSTKIWAGKYVLPTNATQGQVLMYNSYQQKWIASNPDVTRGGGIAIKDLPGASTFAVPSDVSSIKVHVIGGGGGIGTDGEDSIFNITVNSIPVTVSAKGGTKGTLIGGGKGGDVVAVTSVPSINFTGVGTGVGGTGGGLRIRGSAGSGNSGGYGGGGGGGAGGISIGSLPVGTISWFATSAVPPGYLECNGDVLSQNLYPELYSVILTNFNTGGEGSGNFRLPDLRGEFIRGWDHNKGIDPGRQLGSSQSDLLKSHSHGNGLYDRLLKIDATFTTAGGSVLDNVDSGTGTEPSLNTSAPLSATGGVETRPRNIALMPCIKRSTTEAVSQSIGGGGGGSGIGGGGGGSSSGVGGSGSGYGGSGNSNAEWGGTSTGYGGGASSTGYGAGGGGGYAVFSLNVSPGSVASVVVGAAGTGGTGGKAGAVIIEW